MEKTNKIVTLEDTARYMISTDYKEQFIGEYYQIKIRSEKLEDFIKRYHNKEADFKPTCGEGIYYLQLAYMKNYMDVLKDRAKQEGIDLDNPPEVYKS